MSPQPAPLETHQVVQREWPPLRCRIVDIASSLDRLEAAGAEEVCREAEALLRELLSPGSTPRAERVLGLMSRPYDPAWQERFAAGETAID